MWQSYRIDISKTVKYVIGMFWFVLFCFFDTVNSPNNTVNDTVISLSKKDNTVKAA